MSTSESHTARAGGPSEPMSSHGSRAAELRLAEAQRSLAAVTSQNERLATTLRAMRATRSPSSRTRSTGWPAAGRVRHLPAAHHDDSVDIVTGGRKLRVTVSPNVELDELQRGQEVLLNEAMNVVAAFAFEQVGEVVMVKEVMADGQRVLVPAGGADEERVVRLRRC